MKIKKYKIARRLGPIFEKTQGQKFAMRASNYKYKEAKHPRTRTEYGMQMLEKQKIKFTYGLRERQFRRYIDMVIKQKGVKQDQKLLQLLEQRLDNVIYRIGIAPTRRAARQIVNHGHITVNGRKMTFPSYIVKIGDKVGVREGSQKTRIWQKFLESEKDVVVPEWLKFDIGKHEAVVSKLPVLEADKMPFSAESALEFYKR